jgi:glutamyl-tRNA synthetase
MAEALTRIAPTPSGFLHEGNRLNFQTTAQLAGTWGARIALRIDDADAARYRSEYVDDIFATLRDLGIDWHLGPRDRDDFEAHWSQRHKTDYYRDQLNQAIADGLDVYACSCSRSVQRGPAVGGCAGGCRDRGLTWEPGSTSLRATIPAHTVVDFIGGSARVGAHMGDVVLWRRDDLPAYQLVSLVEDRDMHVTHIVRGADLIDSTGTQVYLARWFDAANVAQAEYVHHDLLTDASGAKLSKSPIAREQS